ncbi:hypothetical protein [Nonomuraea sp. NPDC050643]|uniref:hypothetical protein n=1 Tax=Nonomuraea sp. NPDC050643 TaxID=3155660 RepID=UPI0033C7A14F
MKRLSIRLVPVGDTTLVIVLTGTLDPSTRPDLIAVLDPIPPSPVVYVVVAAGDLWSCDLGGLDRLAVTHRALRAKGGHVAIAEAQPSLYRLIGLMTEPDAEPTIALYAGMAAALATTDVETCRLDAPPVPLPRHLPRLRRTRSVQAPARHRRATPPHPEPADPPPVAPVIARSRALREQAADQHRVLADRLGTALRATCRLGEARRRCGDSLAALRATLQAVRTTMAAGRR